MVSDSKNGIKQFMLPRFLLIFFVLLLLSCSAYIISIIPDYLTMKARITQLVKFQKENEQQKRHLLHLAQQITQMTQKMDQIREFNWRIKVMLDLRTNDDNTQFQGIGGSGAIFLQSDSPNATYPGLVRLIHYSLDGLSNEINVQKKSLTDFTNIIEHQKTVLDSTPSIWPAKGSLSSLFGYRISPFTGKKEFHNGIDIYNRINTPIVAPANGFVSASIGHHPYNGKTLSINHGYGIATKYAHLQKILVKKGQFVKRGEVIALLGNTGLSTGPHLHYGVYLNGVPVDPLHYILDYASR